MIFREKYVCQHANKHKNKKTKRNAQCGAFIDIRIKKITRNTKCEDSYLKRSVPLPCIINFNMEHSHTVNTAAALNMLRVDPEVKRQFENYFVSGMRVPEARKLHESKIIAEKGYNALANASINPTINQAYYIYNTWRKKNYGPSSDPFGKLIENIKKYESQGTTIKFDQNEPWSILIVTSVMKRAHSLEASKEIIFLDSTSGCDVTSCTITIMVTPSKAGAIPIAVMLQQNQTSNNYQNAFLLLKKNFPKCFGGNEAPHIFMTDDSSAEKKALNSCWETSKQLLCHFHVAQAEWRWLMSTSSDVIEREDRRHAMKLFQSVMYADSKIQFKEAVKTLMEMGKQFPLFVTRFEKFLQRGDEWLLLHRQHLTTRNHNTNNYCEATIRILKDIILNRTRALNIIALIEFFISVWEVYLIKKILEHAHGRKDNIRLYSNLASKMSNASLADIVQVDDGAYLVPSNSQKNIRYIVETNIGYCTCNIGRTGAFCKHQCFLMDNLKLHLQNAPVLTVEDRQSLAKLALGEKCPEKHFFTNFMHQVNELQTNTTESIPQTDTTESIPQTDTTESILINSQDTEFNVNSQSNSRIDTKCMPLENSTIVTHNSNDMLNVKKMICDEIKRLSQLDGDFNKLKLVAKTLSNIRNSVELNEHMSLFYKLSSIQRKFKRKIKVQATSISRRHPGTSRGNSRIPAGHPSSNCNIKKKRKKRKHQLTVNINNNEPSA